MRAGTVKRSQRGGKKITVTHGALVYTNLVSDPSVFLPIYTALSSHELYSRFLYFPALFSVNERHACVSQWAKAELSLVRYFERPITSLGFLSLTGHFHCELLFLECFIVPLIRWWKDCGCKGNDYLHGRFYWSVTIWGDISLSATRFIQICPPKSTTPCFSTTSCSFRQLEHPIKP